MARTADIGAAPAAAPAAAPRSMSPTWRRFREAFRRHPTAILGAAILIAMIAIAIFAPWLGTVDPQAVSPAKRLRPPSGAFWLGTDMLGRDVYSRVVFGARVSLTVGLAVAALSTLLGLAIGLVTGSLVLSLREQTYVEAAIAAGTTLPRILVRHILPNIVAPLLVQGTYVCGSAMITEAILSFIGAGTPPNIPSWGNIMAEGRSLIQIASYLIVFPGICLSVTVLAVNLLGDGMRDALDPRLARRM
jgi:peptide/nickel transport system permease protein